MKKWILLISLLLVAFCTLSATPIWTEDFATPPFTAGTNVTGINGWATHSGATNFWKAATGNLTYANYSSPGVGLSVQCTAMTGEDVNKTFTAISSGDIYAGFLFNASSTGWTSATGDYEINLGTPPSAFYAKVYVKRDATLTNKFTVGITKTTAAAAVYGATVYDTGTTYLFIIKYSFVAGGIPAPGNDVASLWVNPPTPGTETTPTVTCTGDAVVDPASITAFMLRQGASTAPCTIDAIKLGTTWADIYPAGAPTGEISVGASSLTFTTPVGTPSGVQTYDLEGITTGDITITPPAGFEVSSDETPGWNTTAVTVTPAFKTISVRYNPTAPGTVNLNITHTATNAIEVDLPVHGTGTTVASIVVNPTSRTFTTAAGTTSAYQSYTLTGTNIVASIVVTAPAGYTVCDTPTGTYASTITVANNYNGLIYVKFTPPGYGTYAGNITNVADGITTNMAVSGTGTGTLMNIAVGVTATQNFDAMGVALPVATVGTNLPPDWKADKNTTVRLVGTYAAAVGTTDINRTGGNDMIATAGNGIWNLGAGVDVSATDRCVGFVSSSAATKSGNLYAKLTNTGATQITALEISYNAEKYRTGTNPAGYQMQMYYSLDGTTWTTAGPDFLTAWAADATTLGYASAPGDTKAITTALLPVVVPAAANVYLAWNYSVTSGTATTFSQALGIDDVVVTGRALDIVAVPTFTPTPGIIYTGSQLVTINCATAGASIRYTTDGVTEPTATVGTLYTAPFSISTTTTIKAVGYKAAWIESAVQTGTYTFPINVANIAALRAGVANSLTPYKLTGEAILTLQSTVTAQKNKYIQDGTGAIQIYDPTPYKMTTAYNLGDGITGIVGTLTLYHAMLEFVPLQDAGAATSTGHIVTPSVVTIAGLTDAYQGKLVTMNSLTVAPPVLLPTETNLIASQSFPITDASDLTGTNVIRTQYTDLNYVGTPIPTVPSNVTGVILKYDAVWQLVPRSLADIVAATAITAPINPTITYVGNDVHLGWGAVSGATSYNIYASDKPEGPWTLIGTSLTNAKVIANDALNYPHRFYQITAAN